MFGAKDASDTVSPLSDLRNQSIYKTSPKHGARLIARFIKSVFRVDRTIQVLMTYLAMFLNYTGPSRYCAEDDYITSFIEKCNSGTPTAQSLTPPAAVTATGRKRRVTTPAGIDPDAFKVHKKQERQSRMAQLEVTSRKLFHLLRMIFQKLGLPRSRSWPLLVPFLGRRVI